MFAGLAVLLWLVRDLPKGTARDAISSAMAVMWTGIACTGIYEYVAGSPLRPSWRRWQNLASRWRSWRCAGPNPD